MASRKIRRERRQLNFNRPGAALVRYVEQDMPRSNRRESQLARLSRELERVRSVFLPKPVYRRALNRVLVQRTLPREAVKAFHPQATSVVGAVRSLDLNKARVCAKRQVRREVLHALKVAGKTGIGKNGVKRTPDSKVGC